MDAVQRVMTALRHRRPDRIPIFDSFWDDFAGRCIQELNLPENTIPEDYFGIDIGIAVADETPFPTRRKILKQHGDTQIERDGWGRVIETKKGAFFYRELETAITGIKDLNRLQFDSPSLDSRYHEFLEHVASWRNKRCVFCKTGGPYLRTTYLRGETNFLMDIVSDPPFAKALADRMADHIIQIGLTSLQRGQLYDTGLGIYDDMAFNDQPFMSPTAFERIFLPAYRRMISAFKDAGAALVILHSDGNIGPLLDMFIDAGIDGINPVEPRAGLHVPTLKLRYGEKLAYIGGMCNSHVLPQGPETAIRAQACEIIDAGRDGGVIIGAHSIGPDIPISHYLCYHRTVRRMD